AGGRGIPRIPEISPSTDDIPLPAPPPEYLGPGSPKFHPSPPHSPPNWLPPPPDFDDMPEYATPMKYQQTSPPKGTEDQRFEANSAPMLPKPHLISSPSSRKQNESPVPNHAALSTFSAKKQEERPTTLPRSQTVSTPIGRNQYDSPETSRGSTSKDGNKAKPKRYSDAQISEAALELFQEELRNSIAQKRGLKVWKKITCPEHNTTDCYYITSKSPQSEVLHWLELKGFTEEAMEILKPMNAEMLFNLKKPQLEKYLGEEGAKLHNFLLIQKNMSGYKTCTSQELKQILEERRHKADDV
ncbi:SAM_3 domain-containing protein, partial [Nephila pilipes]